jgi:hypothetical protein
MQVVLLLGLMWARAVVVVAVQALDVLLMRAAVVMLLMRAAVVLLLILWLIRVLLVLLLVLVWRSNMRACIRRWRALRLRNTHP